MATVQFTSDENIRRASLDLVVYAGDSKQRVVGQLSQRLDFKRQSASSLDDHEPPLFQSAEVTVKRPAKYVKVIGYDRNGQTGDRALRDSRTLNLWHSP